MQPDKAPREAWRAAEGAMPGGSAASEDAMYLRNRQRVVLGSGRPVKHRYPWTAEEDEIILSSKFTMTEKARMLGRTYWAARQHFVILREEKMRTLKKILEQKKLSSRWLARETGIPTSTLSEFINHGRLPQNRDRSEVELAVRKALLKEGVNEPDLFATSRRAKIEESDDWEGEMLTQEAMDFYHLADDPFDRQAIRGPADILRTTSFRDVRAILERAIARRQFLAIWGDVGSGKTLLWADVAEGLAENVRVVKPVILEKEKLTVHNLQEALIVDLKAARPDYSEPLRSSKEARDRQIQDLLVRFDSEGTTVVLLIEEAHVIPLRTMKALKRLHEIQRGFATPLAIVLLGQPELRDAWLDVRVREVTRRCRLVELPSLRKAEIKAYVAWKFKRIDADAAKVFGDDAWEALGRKVPGPSISPLMTNNLVVRALNEAAGAKVKRIDASFIDALRPR